MALVPQPPSFPSAGPTPRAGTLLLGAAPCFGVRSPAAVRLRGRLGAQGIAPMRGALREGCSLNSSFPLPLACPEAAHPPVTPGHGEENPWRAGVDSWRDLAAGDFWL